MERRWFLIGCGLCLGFFLGIASTWAGEVVTSNVRMWAQKVLKEEKTLRLVEARNTVAVLYFENKTGRSEFNPLQKGLTLMFITDLSKVKELQVVERIRIQALVEEMGFGASGMVDSQTIPRVGRLLGARWIIGGEIKEGSISIQANLLDVGIQKIIGQPMIKGEMEDLFKIEKDLLFEMIKFFKIEIAPMENEELRRPCSTNHKALMALFKGIEASDRGNYEEAAEYYEKALKEDPGICMARGALEELYALGLLPGKGRSRRMLRSIKENTSLTDQLAPEDATKRTLTPERQPSKIPR